MISPNIDLLDPTTTQGFGGLNPPPPPNKKTKNKKGIDFLNKLW